ncbi:hypothetical protein HDU98_008346 [Podochytrium sp. JEL0797]|nr:hypothetical protein HDU98_008346 [Podochytrium sp. JEL0797]
MIEEWEQIVQITIEYSESAKKVVFEDAVVKWEFLINEVSDSNNQPVQLSDEAELQSVVRRTPIPTLLLSTFPQVGESSRSHHVNGKSGGIDAAFGKEELGVADRLIANSEDDELEFIDLCEEMSVETVQSSSAKEAVSGGFESENAKEYGEKSGMPGGFGTVHVEGYIIHMKDVLGSYLIFGLVILAYLLS